MARAPSYDFERRERQKAKEAKRAEKTKSKDEKKSGGHQEPFEPATDAVRAMDKAISKQREK